MRSSFLIFRSKHRSAKPVKKLWHALVCKEQLKDVFIKYAFKGRDEVRGRQVSEKGRDLGRHRFLHHDCLVDVVDAVACTS